MIADHHDPRRTSGPHVRIGLYLNPPDRALILSCDEKSQIQALDRTQPGLSMKRGRAGTATHDYKRNGTTTLFAALNTFDGTVISMCQDRHRHEEWLEFLRLIDRRTPKGWAVHLIVDNYATHKHAEVKAWLAKHPRFVIHFTPTSASWRNMVERLFRDISENRIRRGSFSSVDELKLAISQYIDQHMKSRNHSSGWQRPPMSSPRSRVPEPRQRWRQNKCRTDWRITPAQSIAARAMRI